MNFPSWLKYVQELTDTRGLDIHDVREALILCGKPSRPVLPFDKSALTNRLTDVSRYFELVLMLVFKCNPQGIFRSDRISSFYIVGWWVGWLVVILLNCKLINLET